MVNTERGQAEHPQHFLTSQLDYAGYGSPKLPIYPHRLRILVKNLRTVFNPLPEFSTLSAGFSTLSAGLLPDASRLRRHCMRLAWMLLAVCFGVSSVVAQPVPNSKYSPKDKFFQIDAWLPTPNQYRTASGAPGPEYWQQRADYDIDATIDDTKQVLSAKLKLTYHNQSPMPLNYIWMQLDQNHFEKDSEAVLTSPAPRFGSQVGFRTLENMLHRRDFDGGYKLDAVTGADGKTLNYTVVKTMMRIDLDKPLLPGQKTVVNVDYHFNIVNARKIRSRGGFEYFEKDDNYLYEMAQWFPRIVAYTDYQGWQHKQFLGRGEFTLELGDYRVRITVPEDMIVAATGELQNAPEVLTEEQRARLKEAQTARRPMYIVTADEAKENEKTKPEAGKTKTWEFAAKNVRDFAFAASRKFAWDAMGVEIGDRVVLAMSYFPNEGNPLWHQYSTEAVGHTLEVYGKYSFEYPYPVAISVNGPVGGMEYPMICFNGPRPEEDGTYSRGTKYALISVIIHEVGHNFYPMIINSDERKWTWMDEGLNTFLQFLTEQEWEEGYPSRRGDPANIASYMRGGSQRPIMTGSEEILQFGANAYAKPATALNILRETILGRELFDFAFKEYARRWRFRRPTPADFFRTMEDASGVDLDWFWRGWFYSTDHVDIAVTDLELFVIDSGDPEEASERRRKEKAEKEPTMSAERNKPLPKRIESHTNLVDFYNSDEYDELSVSESERKSFQKFLDSLDDDERKLLRRSTNFYVVTFENRGGLVMPIIFRLYFEDGSQELVRIPAEIWRANSDKVSKMIMTEKTITRILLDPRSETADTDVSNNHFPPKLVPSRFRLFKSSRRSTNDMQRAKREKEADKKEDDDAKKDAGEKESEEVKSEKPTEEASDETKDAKEEDSKSAEEAKETEESKETKPGEEPKPAEGSKPAPKSPSDKPGK